MDAFHQVKSVELNIAVIYAIFMCRVTQQSYKRPSTLDLICLVFEECETAGTSSRVRSRRCKCESFLPSVPHSIQ